MKSRGINKGPHSCATLIVTTPSASDGYKKRPRSSLFVNRHAPWPSCQMILIRSPQLVSLYVSLSDPGQADHFIVLIINVVFRSPLDHALHRYAYCFRSQRVDRNQPLRALDCLCCRQDAL